MQLCRYRIRRPLLCSILLVTVPLAFGGRDATADYSLSWCRNDKSCFGSVEYRAAAEACLWAVDGALPYGASWRFSPNSYRPPKRAFLGYKVVNLRKGIIRLVGDRITAPASGKSGRRTTYLYSCDWHAIDRRIDAMSIQEERRAPIGLRHFLKRPNCRRFDCNHSPDWER